jgi:hypothetical protein
MSEVIKILLTFLMPFLIGGAVLCLTCHNRRLQLQSLMVILLGMNLWHGFSGGWRTPEFIRLGLTFCVGIIGWVILRREQKVEQRDDHHSS